VELGPTTNLIARFAFGYFKRMLDMPKDFTVVIGEGEDGYLISEVLELPGCHTQAKTLDELMKRTKEAIKVYLHSVHEEPLGTKFLGIQKLAV
jgi:predicted RNase H-like HicB family nuclease